jgi:4-amino-4-deoxy-L-arabinose transferase-like glycosyltransferase
VPFVVSEKTLYLAQRTPERTSPPLIVIPLGLIGLALGGGLFLLWRRRSRAAVPLAIGIAVVLTIFGLVLLFLRFMTPHLAAYQNTNVFTYNPLWLTVLVALPIASRVASARRVVFWLATIIGALTAFGVIAPFLPGLRQGSFAVIALVAPAALVAAWIFREWAKPAPASVAPVTADS